MRYRIFIYILLVFSTSAWAQMPPDATYPPCSDNQVQEHLCLSYVTAPDGSSICAPDGWTNICVPDVSVPDENEIPNVDQCRRDSRTCLDDTPVKEINGVPVTLEMVGGCWKWRRDYTCSTENILNTCQEFEENPLCEVYTHQCIDGQSATCKEWQFEYRCLTKEGTSHQIEFCGDTEICIGDICWDTSYEPDEDFAQVVTDLEAARQMGVYSPDGLNIFGGVANTCRSKRAGGLKNCCKTNTSARSNNKYMGEVISGATGFAVRAGSKYMFDALYGDTLNWVSSGFSAALAGKLPGGQSIIDSIASPSFSMYGFSIGGSGTFLGTTGFQLGQMGGFNFYFNPYAFAFSVGLQIIMQSLQCSDEEALLAMRRGANLCTDKIGDWCSKKVLGVCITRKRSYCCFNSKLAKIINVQGRSQLGRGWEDSKEPNCSGFTPYELESIDFSLIDMSEFVGDVMEAYDPSHLYGDINQSQSGDFVDGSLQKACQSTFNAVGGDTSMIPEECRDLVN